MGGTAGRQSLPVGASEYKRGLLLAWNDRDAFRLFQKLLGDALSGALMISWKTWVAFSIRPVSSLRSEAKAGRTRAKPAIETINKFLYIVILLERFTSLLFTSLLFTSLLFTSL